jgi:hypothetical protein
MIDFPGDGLNGGKKYKGSGQLVSIPRIPIPRSGNKHRPRNWVVHVSTVLPTTCIAPKAGVERPRSTWRYITPTVHSNSLINNWSMIWPTTSWAACHLLRTYELGVRAINRPGRVHWETNAITNCSINTAQQRLEFQIEKETDRWGLP